MSTELINGDRRADRRYQFDLQLQFQYSDERGALHGGCGVTAELSRGGIRFFTEEPLRWGLTWKRASPGPSNCKMSARWNCLWKDR